MKNHNDKIARVLEDKNPAKKLSEVLNQLMTESDIDGVQLSLNTGIPVTTINRLRKGDSSSNPTLATLVPLAQFFSITVSNLIGDELLPLNRLKGGFKPDVTTWKAIPHLTWEQAGLLLENNYKLNEILKYTATDLDISSDAFGITMEGDSMYPRFPDGTLYIIEPHQKVTNRDFILIMPIGSTKPQFKQILVDGSDYYIKSLNKDFKEIKKIKLGVDHQIIGVMIQARMEFKK